MPDRRSSLASLARQAVIISNGLTSAAIAARMPHCLARPCLRCPAKPSCASATLPLSVSLSAFPPAIPLAGYCPRAPRYHPLSSSLSIFCFSFPPSRSLTAAARSLGLSEAGPLVFLLFPSRLRLLLVITTNLSRINSPSGINSSTVQAEKEKVIAGVGTGSSHPLPRRSYSSRAPRIRLGALCAPLRRERERERERERGRGRGRMGDGRGAGVECLARSVMLRERGWKCRRAKTVNVVTSRNEERPRVHNSSGAR